MVRGRMSVCGALAGALGLALLLALPVAALAQKKVNLRLDWKTKGGHAPYHLAAEQGLFQAEGLQVEIFEGQGSATTVKTVATGQDTFGWADFGTMAKGVSQGVPVKAIFGVLQTSPMVVMAHADKNVRHPKDLEGKRIVLSHGDSTSQILPALMKAAGADYGKLNIVFTTGPAKIPAFLDRRVDAMTGYSENQQVIVEASGAKITVIKYADYGVNTLSNGTITSSRVLREEPETVKKFLRAVARGIRAAQADPKGAVAVLVKRFPAVANQEPIFLKQLTLSLALLETPNTKGKPLGWMAREDWENTLRILKEYGELPQVLPVEEYYTNDFIPAS
ncbi:MAG: ABC transporter substrate-binding protein [Deltaproteobacteria bacterium]|nr:ABC transporter substrate-binding protein [Deltaproteobacteria bacterium]